MRKIWDIHGGIHPPENKTQSLSSPVQNAGLPDEIVLPFSQHIGAPAAPIVEVGQRVLKGEKVAEAKGFVSVPIHASTSGEVIAIEERVIPHPSGMSAPCIVIRPDGRDEWIAHSGVDDYTALDKGELLNLIRDAGIAGMGGAGFPSAVKLSTRDEQVIETLILNGTECEPYITADDILMRERAEEIIAGAQILHHLVNPSKETLIGIEDNKPEAIERMRAAAEGTGIEVVVFPTKYPSGGEKQLIQILTDKEVPSGGLSADIGIVCQNVGTCAAIYRAVKHGEPLISRITTVTGDACREPRNYQALIGTPVKHLLALSGFDASNCSRLVMGGPMMGYALESDAVPLVKTSNCVLAPTREELPPPTPAQACIRCGMCAEACPASLLPQQLYWFARSREFEKLEEHNLFDCIECGACSYSCPSNIPLVQYYRASKGEIRHLQQEKVKAEHSKQRFEARQARLEREEAEKEARRKARQEAAKAKAAKAGAGGDDKQDIIQAAIARSQAKKQEADPAKAAIERAQAKRDGTAPEESAEEKLARLQQAVASAEKRLTAAEGKLAQARTEGSDTADALAAGLNKVQAKLDKAREELAAHQAAAAPQPVEAADPAQAAIERAKAARDQQASQSPQEKAEQQLASLRKRLANTEQKLAAAREEGSDKVEILESSCAGIRDKLQAAEAELASLSTAAPAAAADESSAGADSTDPAQAAIARAMAARAASANLSEEEKLQQNIQSLETRLAKAREKSDAAAATGDDNAELLASSVEKLEAKLAKAKEELAALHS